MRNIILFFALCSILVICSSVSAEICIAGRCTDATSIGSISVRSTNGSWNCSGPGCSAFERQVSGQVRHSELQRLQRMRKIQRIKPINRDWNHATKDDSLRKSLGNSFHRNGRLLPQR